MSAPAAVPPARDYSVPLETPLLSATSYDEDGDDDDEDPMMRTILGRASSRTLIPVIFFSILFDMLVYSTIPGVTAAWFARCEGIGASRHCEPNFETALAVTGAVDAASNLFSFFSAALIGRLSDVHGRRAIMMAGLVIGVLPRLVLFLTDAASPAAYFSACAVSGVLGVGTNPAVFAIVSNAYIADVYSKQDRAAQFGLVGGFSALALVFNPLLSALTRGLSVRDLCGLSLASVVLVLAYVAFLMPESLPRSRRNKFSPGRTLNPGAPLALLSQSSVMRWTALIVLLGGTAETGVREIALAYCDKVLGLSGDALRMFNTYLFACIGAGSFLTSTVFLRAFLGCGFRGTTLLALGQFANAFHMGVYAMLHFFPYPWVMYSNALPTALTILSGVAANSVISVSMGPLEQGFALGTLQAVNGIGNVVGPLLYSQLFSIFSRRYEMPQAPFYLGIIFALGAAALACCSPLRTLEGLPKRQILSSHSRVYEADPDIVDDVLSEDELEVDDALYHRQA